jgi:mannose-6-phosphate isomerase-like protein (cupin superfamily)
MSVVADATRPALVTESGAGHRIFVLGAEVTIKIASADTRGAFTVFEGVTQPLQGPPLHRHKGQDEYWYIVEGQFRFEVDGREIYARTGDTVFAPRGSSHTFQNVGDTPGRTITTAIPGGIDVFFEEIEAVAPRGSAPDPARLMPVFKKHRQELLGPPLRARGATNGGSTGR